MDEELLEQVSSKLIKEKLTLATAESCSGGLIAHILTNISGSSNYFIRGFVTYSNESKMELLDVDEDLLIKYGAVSKQVVKAMAEGTRKKSNVDIGIATTGIAGPTGGTIEKPVGLVYVAVSTKDETVVEKFQFSGSRIDNKESICNAALQMLFKIINR